MASSIGSFSRHAPSFAHGVMLVEKAYAKAHGSYQSISGGMVAEALLDLTGAPTEMIYLGDDKFDSELMWARLRSYRALGLPMGCGTNNAEGSSNLKEVGLVGGHAYSILDVREAVKRTGETVRLEAKAQQDQQRLQKPGHFKH